jgi:hypothetical protein
MTYIPTNKLPAQPYSKEWIDEGRGLYIEIFPSGNKYWMCRGSIHREDGPAVVREDGHRSWWYHGEKLNCDSQEQFERLLKLKAFW